MFRFHFGNQNIEGNGRRKGLGFFRDLDIVEMGLGIFEGSKVERGRELSPVSRVLIVF